MDFKKLIAARFLFSFATRTQAIVVGWTMYALPHDPLHLGLVGLAEAVPAISLAMVAGYVVDHGRPVRIYAGVILGSLLSALVVLLSQWPSSGLGPELRVLALYVSSLITGAARGFSQPSMYAIVPRLKPRGELSQASATMTTAMQLASVTGPAVGGLLYGACGITAAAAMVCILLMVAGVAVAAIATDIPAPPPEAAVSGRMAQMTSGARFVFGHPLLLPALSLDMFSVLFGGVTALLPIFADILKVGPMGLGTLRAAPAVGAGLMGLALSHRLDVRARAGPLLFASVSGFGVAIVVFALSHNFGLSLAALAFSGAFDSVSMVIRGTAVQLASPDAMRGRISAVNSIFIGSSNELGEFESGVAAKWLGTVPSVLLGGAACLVTVAIVWLLSPALRSLDLHRLEAEGRAPEDTKAEP